MFPESSQKDYAGIMKHEYSCGAVVYRYNKTNYEYLLIRDRHGNFSFPKGHREEGESEKECAIREIYEEVGIKITAFADFKESSSYPLDEDTIKHVTYFLADSGDQQPFINDGEVQEICFLAGDEALEKLTYDKARMVLSAAIRRLEG